MRKVEINYNNTENLINNLRTILDGLDDEQRNVKQALGEIYDLENYYRNRNEIIDELEFRERKIYDDIRNTEELIKSIELFSRNIQETDERLAHKFKQDIKSYAKVNNLELVSEFDKWLNGIQIALDGAGLFPVVGEIADAINGVIYLAKGDIGNAGISFLAVLPVAGDSLKSIRYLDKASDVLKYTDKAVDLEKSSKKLSKATENLKLKNIILDNLESKAKNVRHELKKNNEIIRKSDDFKNLSKTQQRKIERKLKSLENGGNIAVADVNIPGIKNKFQAHSKINSVDDIGSNIGDFSYKPKAENRKLTSYVDADGYSRYHDTEAKILEDIVSKIDKHDLEGRIDLYSELDCCQSCSNLILEFRRKYPNIDLNIFVKSMK